MTTSSQLEEKTQFDYFSICYLPLAEFLRSSDMALLVQRMHYWLQNEHCGYLLQDGCKWIHNSYKDWHEQFPWLTIDQIGRLVRHLESINWVISERFYTLKREIGFVGKAPSFHEDNQRKWYRLDYQKIFEDTNFDLLFYKYGRDEEVSQKPKHARRANLQNYRKQSVILQKAICNSTDSSIYKEKPLEKPHIGVVEEKKEIDEEIATKKTLDQQPEPKNSQVADELLISAKIPKQDSRKELTVSNLDKSSAPGRNAVKNELPQLPRQKELLLNGVRLDDPELMDVVNLHPDRLITAVDAFIEYCNTREVKKPTQNLILAIKRDWKPENPTAAKTGLPEEINPPSFEQMQRLEQLKVEGRIRDIYLSGDGITKVVLLNHMLMPWWQFLGEMSGG